MYILPFYNMSMLMPRYFILQRLRSSSSFTKRFIAEGCAVGFCCGCYRYGHELLDGRADLGTGRVNSATDFRPFGFSSCWVSYVGFEEFSPSLMSWLVNHLSKFFLTMRFVDPLCKRRWGERNTKWFLFIFFPLWYEYLILWQVTTVKDAIPSSFFHQLPSIFGIYSYQKQEIQPLDSHVSNRDFQIPILVKGLGRYLWSKHPTTQCPWAIQPCTFLCGGSVGSRNRLGFRWRCNGNRKTTSWTASFFRGFYDKKTCVMIFKFLFWIQNALRVVGWVCLF